MGTHIQKDRTLTFTEADATPLDGTTTGRTFQADDRVATQSLIMSERCDKVAIDANLTGTDGNTVDFKIYGYSADGPAKLIYSGTATAGTAISGTDKLYADTFTAQTAGIWPEAITIVDSAANRVASLVFDTRGVKYLVIEPGTFTTATSITFRIREYGSV